MLKTKRFSTFDSMLDASYFSERCNDEFVHFAQNLKTLLDNEKRKKRKWLSQ